MVFRREHDEDDVESAESSDFAKMLDESLSKAPKKLKAGDRVRAEVLSVGREHVIVTTGTPHDGFIPREDMLDEKGEPKVTVGEKIDVFVIRVNGNEIFLSPNANAKSAADGLEDAYRRELTVDGKVEEVIKGGFHVTVMGKRAFCPISQLDTKHIEKPEEYLGKKFEFKITQYSERGRNIVVSRRRLLSEQQGVAQAAFIEQKHVGDTVTGTVSRLESFGAFIEIAPGVEGMAHISELSWSRVASPSEAVEIGQQVSAKILKIEPDGNRTKISLSIKQVQEQPWLNLPAGLIDGAVLTGRVTRCLKFGAFVELFPGIEGLIPLSEMSYTKRVVRSDELVKEGEKISVKVKEIDAFAKRISLSLRDAEGGDPWATAAETFKVGTFVPGTVERRENYGLFIKLTDGVTGLLPKSKGMENPEFGFERLRPGDKVKVRIAEVKTGERRISLDVSGELGSEDWQNYQAAKDGAPAASSGGGGMLAAQLKAAMERSSKK